MKTLNEKIDILSTKNDPTRIVFEWVKTGNLTLAEYREIRHYLYGWQSEDPSSFK